MTTPGAPVSPGIPLLEHAARDAINTARSRLDVLTRGSFPFPVKELSGEEKEEALKSFATSACRFCASQHAGASTAACPRLATFKLNGDGDVIEGSFWPSGGTDSVVETDGDGKVRSVTYRAHAEWDVTQVVSAAELAEEETGESGAHPG